MIEITSANHQASEVTNIASDANPISISKEAVKRIIDITSKTGNHDKHLRIMVSGGGCSGFQYNFLLDDQINSDDVKISENKRLLVVIDPMSLDFLRGSTLNYISDLGGSFFKIDNPNAKASCGCGSSFAV